MNYASALDLLRSNATPDKKKNVSKVTQAMKTMLHYDVDQSLLSALVFYLSYEKPSSVGNITRMVFYLMNHNRVDRLEESDFPGAFSALDILMGKKSTVPLRVETVKSFACVLPENFAAKAKVDELCVAGLRVDGGSAKKKGGKETTNKAWLQYASLFAYRHRELADESTLHLVLESVTSEDPVAARHALAIIGKYAAQAKYRAFICTNLLQFLIAGQSGARANLEDELARVYMTRLLADLGNAPDDDEAVSNRDAFYSILCQRVMDQSDRVSYEAIHSLARGNWARLAESTLATYADGDADANFLLPLSDRATIGAMITRLCVGISNKAAPVPLAHATFRAALAVCKAHIHYAAVAHDMSDAAQYLDPAVRSLSHVREVPMAALSASNSIPHGHLVKSLRAEAASKSTAPKHPLLLMFNTLDAYVRDHTRPSKLRLTALKCVVWLAYSDAMVLSERIIAREIRDGSLSAQEFASLFCAVLERVQATPCCCPLALNLVLAWRNYQPSGICHETVGKVWTALGECGASGQFQVLQNLFACLDLGSRPETKADDARFIRFALSHLGSEAANLTSQCGADGDLDGESDDGIRNQPLEAALLRLESAALFSDWETRNVAVEAMAKIAILTQNVAARKHVLQFCAESPPEACTKNRCDTLAHVVGRLMDAKTRWAERMEECGGNLSEYYLELVSEEKMLRSLTELFRGWTSTESCIGPEFTKFLTQA